MSKLNLICNCQNVHVERERAEISSQDFLILINQRDLEIDAYAYSNFDLMLCEWYKVPRVLYKRAWPFKSTQLLRNLNSREFTRYCFVNFSYLSWSFKIGSKACFLIERSLINEVRRVKVWFFILPRCQYCPVNKSIHRRTSAPCPDRPSHRPSKEIRVYPRPKSQILYQRAPEQHLPRQSNLHQYNSASPHLHQQLPW